MRGLKENDKRQRIGRDIRNLEAPTSAIYQVRKCKDCKSYTGTEKIERCSEYPGMEDGIACYQFVSKITEVK